MEFEFHFKLEKETLTQAEKKTITMYRGIHDRFSCSAGFCCNREKKVNFNSVDLKNNNRVDWIKFRNSENSQEVPLSVIWCTQKKSSTPKHHAQSSSSNHDQNNFQDLTSNNQRSQSSGISSLTQLADKNNALPANLVVTQRQTTDFLGSQTNDKNLREGSTSNKLESQRSDSSSLTESTVQNNPPPTQTGGTKHQTTDVSGSQ
ncbi:hypothetical protein HMI54_009371, partial [Coelomomyces lativittatus]